MLAARHLHLSRPRLIGLLNSGSRPRLIPPHGPSPRSKRTFLTSTLQSFSDGFLDLALALPYPPSWPPYSSTIILITVLTRLVVTLPFSIWAKQRQQTLKENVVPELQKLGPELSKAIYQNMKQSRAQGTREELIIAHSKRLRHLMSIRRRELCDQYKCHPITTAVIPVVTQFPVFTILTLAFYQVAEGATPLEFESFLTLTSLNHRDPTATLPIALGIISLANVESSRWFMSEEQQLAEVAKDKRNEEKMAKGEVVIEPNKIIRSGLRVMSIGRILFGAVVPGSVIVYWVTSATFGLFQSWAFDWWAARRARNRRIQDIPPPHPPQKSGLSSTPRFRR